MYENQAIYIYGKERVPFPFSSQLVLCLQYVNSKNKLSKVISCLKFYIFHVTSLAFQTHKIQFGIQFYASRH